MTNFKPNLSFNNFLSWEDNTLNFNKIHTLEFTFSNQLTVHPTITAQEASGRCWLFAGLNVLRTHECLSDPSFEWSQNYLFFWDKYERSKYFLYTYPNINETGNKRLIDHFMKNPVVDGGQWNMFVNLVEKYGLVPKTKFPDTYSSKNSKRLNMILNNRLKEAVVRNENKNIVLQDIFQILVSFLGTPPRPTKHITLDNYISVINDPRNDYNKWYTVDHLNNMIEGKPISYLNKPMETLEIICKKSINNNEAVWFGADISPFTSRDLCISGLNYFDYPHYLDKKEGLITLDSAMTHAMVLHGYNETDGVLDRWKVENSWGVKGPYKGYYIMDHDWFNRFVYQIVIDKKHLVLPKQTKPKVLPLWDPFGSLATKSRLKNKKINKGYFKWKALLI